MAGYNYDVKRCTMIGTTFNGLEEWSTGFWIGEAGAAVAAPGQAEVDAIAGFWATYFNNAAALIRAGVKCTRVKLSFYESGAENATEGATVFHDYPVAIAGGQGGSQALPPQISVVASLHASPSLGLAGKGRMFLPGVECPIESDGSMSSANRTNMIAPLKTFFDAVNGSAAVDGRLVNTSKGRIGVPFAPPVARAVTTIRLGSIYDTQRRRRNQLTEQYTAAVLA
jgi:hypothetical protein